MRSIREIFRSYAVLDAEGRHVNGSDKESNHHYGDAYESLFRRLVRRNNVPVPTGGFFCQECGSDYDYHNPFCSKAEWQSTRDAVHLVMEVGVADGSCLLAWREVFPNATIVGMDIHHSDRAHGDRIEFHLGDATSKRDCDLAASGRQFDLIVEDTTHKLIDTFQTLLWLWPYVKPGGLYVVEEWEGVSGERERIQILWPNAEIIGTCGPHIADEPLVVFRKPLT